MAQVLQRVRPYRIPIDFKTILLLGVLLTLGLAVVYPTAILVVNSFVTTNPPFPREYGLGAWQFAFTEPGMLGSLWNTFLVTFVRQGISFPIAIFVAWLLARTDVPASRWLEFSFWVAFFLPVVPVTQAWILLAHPGFGVLNIGLERLPFVESGPFNIFSFWGIIWVHLMTNTIAIKVMLLTPMFRNMDSTLEEASRISGANSITTLMRVTVPVMTPAIATVLLLAVLRAFQSVEIELILGMPIGFFVFGSKIFQLVRVEPANYGAATALGLMTLIAIVPLLMLHRWATMRRSFTTLSGRYRPDLMQLRKWKWPAFFAVFGLSSLIIIVPAIFLLMGSLMRFAGFFDIPNPWTTDHWTRVLQDRTFLRSMRNTFVMSVGAATLSMVLFTAVAYVVVRYRSRLTPVLDFLTWVPYVLPGVVLILAWLWILLQTPFLQPIYGTVFALILVSALSGLTLSVQIIKSNVLQLGNELEEASSITGANPATTMLKIVLPLLAPSMVVIWVLNFVAAAGTAILPALLAAPESKVLALLQFELVMSGRHEAGAIVGLFVVLMTVGVAIIARSFGLRIGLR